ncbi:hypothetical protein BD289DRAFT_364463 [Coniella lustricola]|uniref:GET complex, subunit GET2 n=1 Tax=Coniella lustricola TaxID=2025994 RepID=A0A2T3ADS2_9PEZI|nr:hypothetical protein BD289DRAFT_364463 [Coniella lustricola]
MSPEDAAAARAADQARIRKERREAKIKAGGSARLNKITGLGGGVQRDPVASNPPSQTSSPAPAATATAAPPQGSAPSASDDHHADPEEIDISQHYYEPQTTNRIPSSNAPAGSIDLANLSEDQLRQMMLGFEPPTNGSGPGGGPDAEDPMMKMLSQMLGGGPGGPGGASPFGSGADNPFAQFAAMSGAGGPQQSQQQQAGKSDTYTAIWRILHFVLALGLGLYIALGSSFTGSKVERERGAFVATATGAATVDADEQLAQMKKYFFWTFATAETILLTSRFFLDRGRAAPGMLNMVMGFLPEGRWKMYLGTALRYSQIFTTVRSDLMVCVFVLGVCAWLRA